MRQNLKLSIEPETSLLLSRVNDFLTEQGVEAYLVGGFLRDVLLGRDTADIDIALAADALEVAPRLAGAVGGKFVPLDKVNRVGRVIVADKEAPRAGGRWELDFSSFKDGIEHDLSRRDFTVDAMAVDLKQLGKAEVQLIDPADGLSDLHRGVIRATSETTFNSDAARLLRAVRLAGELTFGIDGGTGALIRRHHHLVAGVAGERIREELLRLLAIPGSGQTLAYLDELGLLTAVIPELEPARGVTQPKEHFWNVFDHSLMTVAAVDFILHQGAWEYAGDKVRASAPWSAELSHHFDLEVSSGSTRRSLLKLAALLHDVAKPQTRAADENGRWRFLGHATEGALAAAGILERLRFSGKEIKLVETVIRHHLRPGQMSQGALPSHRAIYRYFRDSGEAGIDTLFLSLADHLATRGPNLSLSGWREHTRQVEYVLREHFQKQSVAAPPRLVSGHDLIKSFGLSPGPEVGEILETVREAQAAGEVTTRDEALSYVRDRLLTKAVS
ncbi:MAG TPA: metal-dependent phosphohydrolase [Dehalococcoidia bacterium]|nr:metal-dependent phosphohydrolase [Dehalococcoidia bacterium]